MPMTRGAEEARAPPAINACLKADRVSCLQPRRDRQKRAGVTPQKPGGQPKLGQKLEIGELG
ncbi:MAG: hypothetical protein LBO82_07605 [Synergistaceae bacterium]|nr:hypothetical protein [Synergistaceae bacterium]